MIGDAGMAGLLIYMLELVTNFGQIPRCLDLYAYVSFADSKAAFTDSQNTPQKIIQGVKT